MRIACLQFAPHVGDLKYNISCAEAILEKADPKDLDLLVLPEMAFSGKHSTWRVSIHPTTIAGGSLTLQSAIISPLIRYHTFLFRKILVLELRRRQHVFYSQCLLFRI